MMDASVGSEPIAIHCETPTPKVKTKPFNLALQGGCAHGAFTWGVLDRLLEESASRLGGDTARQPDVPGLVPVDPTEDRVGGRLLRQDTIGLEQRCKDQANGGIEGRDRGKV
jgi:hypothetical protein